MALEGSLKEFNLADILQLVYFQKKTGVLLLIGRTDRVRLLFHQGNIVGAESKKRDTADRLGNILLRRGIISQDDLNTAIEKQKDEGGKLGAVLVKEELIGKEVIQEVLQFQITETMSQLFSWNEGRYDFTPKGIPIDKDIGVSLDTQHFLMEGLRLVDEWSEIKDRISIETVFEKTGSQPSDMTMDEKAILDLVDGVSDVGTISDVSGTDSFSVSTSLLSLQEKGAVKTPDAKVVVTKPKKPKKKRLIPQLGFILTIIFIGALSVSLFFSVTGTLKLMKPFSASEKIDMLRYEARIHFEKNGKYPASMDYTDPWGTPYIYKADSRGFTLISAGPDGRPGTGDDIY
jgi:hypothetical protein